LWNYTSKHSDWLEICQPINEGILKSPLRADLSLSQVVYWQAEDTESAKEKGVRQDAFFVFGGVVAAIS